MSTASWYCCQLGAREHYAIPRALHLAGRLEGLFTDAWTRPRTILKRWQRFGLSERWQGRYHADLAQASVDAFTSSLLAFELKQRLRGSRGWQRTMARNRWFEQCVVCKLGASLGTINRGEQPPVLFCYSYAALEILRFAKQQGWQTVLGQIDPGQFEEGIVRQEYEREPRLETEWRPAPPLYWQRWREECALADQILVNSPWALNALRQQGVAETKLSVVPLSFEAPVHAPPPKKYPAHFSSTRPLRVLFLGQINLRKGIARLLKAAEILASAPIEFWLVGPVQISRAAIPDRVKPMLRWFGPVARSQATVFFRAADVFILPTLSDGFALTQLEAMSERLPVIASSHCGQVVHDGLNGLLLPEVSAEAIAAALQTCWRDPERLAEFSRKSGIRQEHLLSTLSRRLTDLSDAA